MKRYELDHLRLELSVKAKNGLDFILAATVVWAMIAVVWTLPYSPYNRSVLTFILGGPMLPLALLLSKFLKTIWTVKENPLQPLGLWLNFAQLFYFPILVFVLIRQPEYFIMTYAIITGAHFFPYAWYYNLRSYAVMAGVISIGSMAIALMVKAEQIYWIPLFMVACLIILGLWNFYLFLANKAKYDQETI